MGTPSYEFLLCNTLLVLSFLMCIDVDSLYQLIFFLFLILQVFYLLTVLRLFIDLSLSD